MAAASGTSGGETGRWTIVWLLLLFTALTVLFTYPISSAPNTYLKDLADSRLVAWTLAWNAHALVTDPLHVFDANIYFPSEGVLAWSETFLLPSLLVAPLNWAGYPVLAYNLVLLSSFVLGGLGATLWVRHMTGSLPAGIVAGVIWAFAPGKFAQVAHLHMMAGQWIPFALLYCSRYIESARSRDLYAMGGFVALQFGFSLHYGVFLLPLLAVYATALLLLIPGSALRASASRLRRDVVIAAALLAALGLVLALPFAGANDEAGLERGYEEMLRYSARPGSFLSGSPFNRAPHARWLHDRYEVVEANYFPGVLPLVLLAAALVGMIPATLWAARRSTRGSDEEKSAWSRARLWVRDVSGALAAAAFILHVAGIVAARQVEAAWARRVIELCVATHPALWVALMTTVALLATPASRFGLTPRRSVYLIVLGYLTLLTYLLAYGPEVQALGSELGRGPYWLLYRFVLPFRAIRAPGRIGALWVLCVAALAGFVVAHVEGRLIGGRRRPSTRGRTSNSALPVSTTWVRASRLGLVALVAVMMWEYRVWPLPHESADPAADPADVWLAQQPGGFAVVHAPIGTGRKAWTETAYMLGSTLHWKRLVNGYARRVPPGYRYLTATPPLGPEFFRRLRAGFPARYLLVHEDRLADDEQRANLKRLLPPNEDAAFVAQLGYTLVFELPYDGDQQPLIGEPEPPLPSDLQQPGEQEPPFRFDLLQEYPAAELDGRGGMELEIRGSQLAADRAVIALAGWGRQGQAIAISDTWRDARVEFPEGYVDALGGGSGAFEVTTYTLVPVGDTGVPVAAGFTIDAQRQGVVVGLRDRVFHGTDQPSFVAHWLDEFGKGVVETRTFPPTLAGAASLRGYLGSLPGGALVAASARLEPARVLDANARAAFQLIGATPPLDEEVSLMVILGTRGAEPGAALQDVRHDHAFIDIEGPTPVFQLRMMRLF